MRLVAFSFHYLRVHVTLDAIECEDVAPNIVCFWATWANMRLALSAVGDS